MHTTSCLTTAIAPPVDNNLVDSDSENEFKLDFHRQKLFPLLPRLLLLLSNTPSTSVTATLEVVAVVSLNLSTYNLSTDLRTSSAPINNYA